MSSTLPKPLRPAAILLAVASATGVSVDAMRGRTRARREVMAREMFVGLCRDLTTASYPEIQEHLSAVSHSSSITRHGRHALKLAYVPEYAAEYRAIRERFAR